MTDEGTNSLGETLTDQSGEGNLVRLDCGLINRIREDFFAKRLTEEPNHGTLAYFIIR
jgi:hypothetical protein